jgi:hypothetical protein
MFVATGGYTLRDVHRISVAIVRVVPVNSIQANSKAQVKFQVVHTTSGSPTGFVVEAENENEAQLLQFLGLQEPNIIPAMPGQEVSLNLILPLTKELWNL